jgi:phosphopantothenoylcysteine decarboxylase/phosphopantothenate--cysteine ligase
MLAGTRIVLGVTGGVAAYKAAYLARRLIEAGAAVRAVMTPTAQEFLGPQTLAAITGRPPVIDLFADENVSPHTDLARWADAVVVAPATAATIARLANGLSEDAVSTTVLATRAPVVVAPAMHTEMWEHPAVQTNLMTLRAYGCTIVDPETGFLAGGDEGIGRLAEPDTIVQVLEQVVRSGPMAGQKILVTAGGTREPIDPVRYIGNRSSGRMGNAIALAAARRGADVVLVTAASAPDHPGIEVVPVETADEMAEQTWRRAQGSDIAVMAAAVADFQPIEPSDTKLRRAGGLPHLELGPTPDVLAGVAAMEDRPFLVGFAAETGSLADAVEKARKKGVDLLVANDVTREGSGFGTETNEVTIVMPDGSMEPWDLASKDDVAERLLDRVATLRDGGGGSS